MADPGFPVGGTCTRWGGGRAPLMWVLFGENVCENERIGSYGGGVRLACPPRSANAIVRKLHPNLRLVPALQKRCLFHNKFVLKDSEK